MLTIILIVVILISLLMVLTYLWATGGEKRLTDDERSVLAGSYIEIEQGVIHYTWHGPEDGPVVVMVHGFSTPQFVFDRNVPALVEAGYRVLTFDHFGRGYSDRPHGPYDLDFYDKELADLLVALGISEPVSLVGYSLGGGIVTVFTARHPEKVKRLVLISPVGFMDDFPWVYRLVCVPLVGEYFFAVIAKPDLIKEFRAAEKIGHATTSMLERYEQQFEYRGAWKAMLSTVRHYPMDDLTSYYQRVAREQKPVMVIWGTADETVSVSGADRVIEAIAHAEKEIVSDAGHGLLYSHSTIVNGAVLKCLSSP